MRSYLWLAALLAVCSWSFGISGTALAHGGTDFTVIDCEDEDGDDTERAVLDCEDEEGDEESGLIFDCHDEDDEE